MIEVPSDVVTEDEPAVMAGPRWWSVFRVVTAGWAMDQPEYLPGIEASLLKGAASDLAGKGYTILTSSGPVWEETNRPSEDVADRHLGGTRPWTPGTPLEFGWAVCRLSGISVPLNTWPEWAHGLYKGVADMVATLDQSGLVPADVVRTSIERDPDLRARFRIEVDLLPASGRTEAL